MYRVVAHRVLIYKMLCRNGPTFDLTIISQICIDVSQRTNERTKKRVYASLSDVTFINYKRS